jgi:simple sugar transport system ATP-binding protein
VDIGASQFIHRKLIEMRDEGKAVLLISNELSEIMSLSDRVLVIYNGSIVGETTPEKSTEEEIGLWMAGIRSASRRTL